MEQEYIKGDIVMYDSKIHTIMDTLGVNNYELSCIEHPVHQLELSGVPLTPEILEKNGWKKPDGFDSYWLDKMGLLQEGDTWHSALGSTKIAITLGNILYVHQLQHLLFGLGINQEMEVLV
jgi:hypothetical protein